MMKAQQQVDEDYCLQPPVDISKVNLTTFTFSKARAARFKCFEEAYTRKLLHEVHRDTGGAHGRPDPELEMPQQQHWWGRLRLACMRPRPNVVEQPTGLKDLYWDLEKIRTEYKYVHVPHQSVNACLDWLKQLKKHRWELVQAAHASAPDA